VSRRGPTRARSLTKTIDSSWPAGASRCRDRPARLPGRVAESRFASPLGSSGQPPKRTSGSPRSLWSRLGRSRFRASAKAPLSQTARAKSRRAPSPRGPLGSDGPRSSVGLVDGNVPMGRCHPDRDGRFTFHIEDPTLSFWPLQPIDFI
jgi:hypothetical protein